MPEFTSKLVSFLLAMVFTVFQPGFCEEKLLKDRRYVIAFGERDLEFWNCSFHANDYIKSGYPIESTVFAVNGQSIVFLAEKRMTFHDNGTVASGTLGRPLGIERGEKSYTFYKNDVLIFDNKGIIQIEKSLGDKFKTAVDLGQRIKVKGLLGRGVDIAYGLDRGDRALIVAARKGYLKLGKYLIKEGASLEHKNDAGETALAAAVAGGRKKTVRFLLKKGASEKLDTRTGITPLMIYSLAGDTKRAAVQLAASPSMVRARNRDGNTALMYASWSGNRGIAAELVKAGADIDSVSSTNASLTNSIFGVTISSSLSEANPHMFTSGKNALMFASISGNLGIVTVLLAASANIYHKDAYGFAVLNYCDELGRDKIADAIEEIMWEDLRKGRGNSRPENSNPSGSGTR